MARLALVLDASVGVKWFSPQGENALKQALSIRDAFISEDMTIIVPDLFYYEVSNALIHKKFFSTAAVRAAASSLFALGMLNVSIDSPLLKHSIQLSRQYDITVYDACYAAVAIANSCPLVTANPRHQKKGLGCRVIPIEEWK